MKKEHVKALYQGYLADYEMTQDSNSLIKLYQLIKEGHINLTAVERDTVAYLAYNKGDGKCSRCPAIIRKGEGVFYMNKVRWCERCASVEEKQNSFYLKEVKRRETLTTISDNDD